MNKQINVISIVVTLLISFILGLTSIEFLGEYGWVVFVLIPFIIGFLPPFITGKSKTLSRNQAYKLSFATLGIACLGLLVFAIEGFICIIMASPILILPTLIGSYLAFIFHRKKMTNSTNLIILLGLAAAGLMSFDYVNKPKDLIPVRTSIVVEANIEEVWNNVVTFSEIDEPKDWIFKTGIAYPTDATIEGEGVDAIRYCNFTTGSFVEPITTWNEPNLLQFDVEEQPIPMHEYNPFWDIHPPHLDGYFQSYKGQFKLNELDENTTLLEGTTWYQVDIAPMIYWRIWSEFIIHRIHERVLNHIKAESEILTVIPKDGRSKDHVSF